MRSKDNDILFFSRVVPTLVLSRAKDNRVQFGAGSCVSNGGEKRRGEERGGEERQNGTGREGRERDLAGKKSSKLVCSTQQPAGGTKGGVKLGQLGVAAPRGWDQYSLFLSSALPTISSVHQLRREHHTHTHTHTGQRDRERTSSSPFPLLPPPPSFPTRACFPFFSMVRYVHASQRVPVAV